MLKFLIDTQLPPLLADYFRHKGFDAVHTTYYEDGHLLQDVQIIDIAKKENRVVITKDNDFWDYFFVKGYPPDVILVELGNIKNADLLDVFKLHLGAIIALFELGMHLVVLQKNNIVGY